MYSNHTFHTNQIQTLNKAKHHSVNTTCRMKPFESAQTGCAGFFFFANQKWSGKPAHPAQTHCADQVLERTW